MLPCTTDLSPDPSATLRPPYAPSLSASLPLNRPPSLPPSLSTNLPLYQPPSLPTPRHPSGLPPLPPSLSTTLPFSLTECLLRVGGCACVRARVCLVCFSH